MPASTDDKTAEIKKSLVMRRSAHEKAKRECAQKISDIQKRGAIAAACLVTLEAKVSEKLRALQRQRQESGERLSNDQFAEVMAELPAIQEFYRQKTALESCLTSLTGERDVMKRALEDADKALSEADNALQQTEKELAIKKAELQRKKTAS